MSHFQGLVLFCFIPMFTPSVSASPTALESPSIGLPTISENKILVAIQATVLLIESLVIILEISFKLDETWLSNHRPSARPLRIWHRRALLLMLPISWTVLIATEIGFLFSKKHPKVLDTGFVIDQDAAGAAVRGTLYGLGTITGLTVILGHFHAEESGIAELGLALWILLASNIYNLIKSFFLTTTSINVLLAVLLMDGYISALSMTLTTKEYIVQRWRLISTIFLQLGGLIVMVLAIRPLGKAKNVSSPAGDNPWDDCFQISWWGSIDTCRGASLSFWLYFAMRTLSWIHEIILILCHTKSYSLAKKMRAEDEEKRWKAQTSLITSTVFDSVPATVFSNYLPPLLNLVYVCISIEGCLKDYGIEDPYLLETWGQSAQLLTIFVSGYRWVLQLSQMFNTNSIERRRLVLARCSVGTQLPEIGTVKASHHKPSKFRSAFLWLRKTYHRHPFQKLPPRRAIDHARFSAEKEAWKEIILDYRQWKTATLDQKGQMLLDGAKQGDLTLVTDLLYEDAPVNFANVQRHTALHFAAENGHDQIVSRLLQNGADSNLQNLANMETPLHVACRISNNEIAQDLLDSGASPNLTDLADGWTSLHVAARNGSMDVMRTLLRHPRNPAHPNARSKKGKTALHLLVRHGHQSLVDELAAVSDVDIVDNKGKTALYLAARYEREISTAVLLKYNAKPNIASFALGYTPLHACARWERAGVAKLLLESGCDMDINEKPEERTALHMAVSYGREGVVDHLLRAGAKVNVLDNQNRTPLYFAAKDDRDCTRKLLRHTAEANLGDIKMMQNLLQKYGAILEDANALIEQDDTAAILELINGN